MSSFSLNTCSSTEPTKLSSPGDGSAFQFPTHPQTPGNSLSTQIAAEQFLQIEQDVRNALARQLHDGPTQLLTNIKMGLDFCQRILDEDSKALEKELTVLQSLVDRAMHQIRTMLFELRPVALEAEGLAAGLSVEIPNRKAKVQGPKPRDH